MSRARGVVDGRLKIVSREDEESCLPHIGILFRKDVPGGGGGDGPRPLRVHFMLGFCAVRMLLRNDMQTIITKNHQGTLNEGRTRPEPDAPHKKMGNHEPQTRDDDGS